MDRWRAEQGRGREKRKIRRKKSRRERVRRKQMPMREKVGKSRNHCVFPMIWGSGGSKSRLAKAAGAEPAGQMRDEKLHAVVVRSTFGSQHVKNTRGSDHFWKLRCRKSACRCGAKHISKSKMYKNTPFSDHFWKLRCWKSNAPLWRESTFPSQNVQNTTRSGPLLAVEMTKKCTPLWREAHFEVKMYKAHHVRTIFGGSDVEKVHAVVARSTFPSRNVQNTPCTDHFWRFRCRKERQKGRNTQAPFNPSVGSLCHFCATPTHLSYRFSIFETSATALCGTTGIYTIYICILSRSPRWTLKIEKMHARTMLVGPYFCQFWWFERPRWLHFGFGHPNKKHHLQRPC